MHVRACIIMVCFDVRYSVKKLRYQNNIASIGQGIRMNSGQRGKNCHRLFELSVTIMSDEVFQVTVVQTTKGCLCDDIMRWTPHEYILHQTMVIMMHLATASLGLIMSEWWKQAQEMFDDHCGVGHMNKIYL